MRLTSKLETLMLMAVKAAGSYDATPALSRVEAHLTPREFATAAEFLNWIVANKLTFGHGNIRDRFQQFQEAQLQMRTL